MSSVERLDLSFDRLIGEEPTVELMATGFAFTEGPIWRGDHLLFSDLPSNRVVRYEMSEEGPSLTTFRYPSGNANGQALDEKGRLITCEHATRRVTRTELDGTISTLAARYETRRLNSPNDVVVRNDGTIYFTDPPYGLTGQTRDKQLPYNGVFKVDPDTRELTLLVAELARPNGLAFSIDHNELYIVDSASRRIYVYPVNLNGTLDSGRVFAELIAAQDEEGNPDGLKVDVEGNVYSTGPSGIWIYSGNGSLLGKIRTPEIPANLAWGDPDFKGLYITARTGLYRLRVNIPGMPPCGELL